MTDKIAELQKQFDNTVVIPSYWENPTIEIVLQKRHRDMDEFVVRVKQPEKPTLKPRRWKPEKDNWYWLYSWGELNTVWVNDKEDQYRYLTGNCHPTREAAEAWHANIVKLNRVLDRCWEISEGFEPDWEDGDQDKRGLFYDHQNKRWEAAYGWYIQNNNWPIFRTLEQADQSIKELGSDLDILLWRGM